MTASPPPLARRLGLADAVTVGLASMLGAGVFVSFAPAAAAAGAGLLVGLVVAAVVAACNAASSAQLAVQHPSAGGTYVYGRAQLGEWPGFLAGWGFVVGKTASCAAMAMSVAAYAVPGPAQRPVAVLTVLVVAGVNLLGVTRTAAAARVVVLVVLAVLAVVVTAGATSGAPGLVGAPLTVTGGWQGVLESAGLLFFAFAGYARVATLGEEVRDPRRTIPRAIAVALAVVLAVYALVATSAVATLGAAELARSEAPLVDVVVARGWDWAAPAVRTAAAAAALGALLALVAGVGRTTLAMARTGDLPGWLAAVHPRRQVPHHAEIAVAVAVCALVLVADLREVIGFSSAGVLFYYLVTNVAAWSQGDGHRLYARAWQLVGAVGCVVLVVSLPGTSLVGAVAVLLCGVVGRLVARRRRDRRTGSGTTAR